MLDEISRKYKTDRARRHRIEQEKAASRGSYEQQKEAIEAAKMAAFVASTLSALAYDARHLTASDIVAAVENADGLDYLYKGVCLYIYG